MAIVSSTLTLLWGVSPDPCAAPVLALTDIPDGVVDIDSTDSTEKPTCPPDVIEDEEQKIECESGDLNVYTRTKFINLKTGNISASPWVFVNCLATGVTCCSSGPPTPNCAGCSRATSVTNLTLTISGCSCLDGNWCLEYSGSTVVDDGGSIYRTVHTWDDAHPGGISINNPCGEGGSDAAMGWQVYYVEETGCWYQSYGGFCGVGDSATLFDSSVANDLITAKAGDSIGCDPSIEVKWQWGPDYADGITCASCIGKTVTATLKEGWNGCSGIVDNNSNLCVPGAPDKLRIRVYKAGVLITTDALWKWIDDVNAAAYSNVVCMPVEFAGTLYTAPYTLIYNCFSGASANLQESVCCRANGFGPLEFMENVAVSTDSPFYRELSGGGDYTVILDTVGTGSFSEFITGGTSCATAVDLGNINDNGLRRIKLSTDGSWFKFTGDNAVVYAACGFPGFTLYRGSCSGPMAASFPLETNCNGFTCYGPTTLAYNDTYYVWAQGADIYARAAIGKSASCAGTSDTGGGGGGGGAGGSCADAIDLGTGYADVTSPIAGWYKILSNGSANFYVMVSGSAFDLYLDPCGSSVVASASTNAYGNATYVSDTMSFGLVGAAALYIYLPSPASSLQVVFY